MYATAAGQAAGNQVFFSCQPPPQAVLRAMRNALLCLMGCGRRGHCSPLFRFRMARKAGERDFISSFSFPKNSQFVSLLKNSKLN